jgi:hypothetical protein
MALETYGNIVIGTPTKKLTFADVKEFVDYLTQLGVKDDHEFLDGYLTFEFESSKVDIIQCANHVPADDTLPLDFVVSAHNCPIECA